MLKIYIYSKSAVALTCKKTLDYYYDVLGYIESIDEIDQDYDAIYLPNKEFEKDRELLLNSGVANEKIRVYFRYATTGFLDQEMLCQRDEPLIIDVGANVGQTILRYKNVLPDARIVSFEPNCEIINDLKLFAQDYENVEVHNLALGRNEGKLEFNINPYSLYSSFLPFSKKFNHQLYAESPQAFEKQKIQVEMMTLDSYCQSNGINQIDILKIDTEGAEIDILSGAEKLLKSESIDMVYVETYVQQKYENQPLLYDIGSFLYEYGYVMFAMYHFVKKKGLPLLFCDTLFISRPVLKRLEESKKTLLLNS